MKRHGWGCGLGRAPDPIFQASPGSAICGLRRPILVLIVALTLGMGCAPRRVRPTVIVPRTLRNGIVLVFSPASCSSYAPLFPALSRLDSLPGITVLGLMTVAPSEAELAAIRVAYGASFELRSLPIDSLRMLIADSTATLPFAMVVRRGRVDSYLGRETLERGPVLISTLFKESE